MADRSIVVRLRAEVDGFKREMAEATKAVEGTAKGSEDTAKRTDTSMGRMVQSAKQNQAAWTTSGAALTGFGAAALGGLGLATKAAMDWESSWAGVVKTVDGSAPQMAALEAGLRSMARELPATHTEIAAVAEAAGQLGIAVPNILSFTRTMINMGEATNLSSEEAATSLARFINITGTSQSQIGLLGASIVGLGNSFATTESEILGMSMRLAGAGAQANMSEGDILGIATAMSSVGIEAEAGGSAMSQTMKRIGKAVDEGGDSLELFSKVSGMSAEEFSNAWRNDPTTALDAFVTGLSGVEAQGMTTNGVLSDLGITGIREADSLLRLSAASEQGANGMSLLASAVATGNAEFDKGTALIDEASKRYETAESRIAMARNALVDSGISIGSVVLPAFASLADTVAGAAGAFADLPSGIHGTIAVLGGLAGATALGAGGFLLLFPRVMDTVGAFREMGLLSDSMAGKLGRATLTVGKAGLAFAALAAVPPILNAITDAARGIGDLDLGMNELTAGLLEGERTGQMFDSVLGDMYDSGALNKQMFSDLGSTVSQVADIDWFQKLIGPLAATGVNDAKDRLLELSDAFVLLSQTDLSKAQSTFAAFMSEAEASGATFEQVLEVMPSFRDELAGLATSMGLDGTDSAVLYKIAMGELSPVIDETTGAVSGYSDAVEGAADETESAADAADELYQSMTALADGFLNARQAARDYDDALKEAKDTLDANGKAWENGTEKARENAEALDGVSQSVLDNADAMKRNGEDVGGYLEGQREVLWNLARDYGATKDEATAYVDALGLTPEYISTQVELESEAAKEQWAALWTELGYHPPLVIDPTVDPEGKVTEFTGILGEIPPETSTAVGAETDGAIEKAYGFEEVITGATQDQTVAVDADPSGAIIGAEEAKTALGTIPHVTQTESGLSIGPLLTQADRANLELAYLESQKPTPTADLNDSQLVGVAGAAVTRLNEIDGMTPTPELRAEKAVLERVVSSAQGRINGMTGKEVDVTAHAQGFSGVANLRDEIRRLVGKTVTVRTNFVTSGRPPASRPGVRSATFAAGGPVYGPGTGTSDSIPSLLSNGEHVLTAAEVALAGGQDSVYRMRAAIRAGALRFADGGGVAGGGYAQAPVLTVSAPAQARSAGSTVLALDGAALATLADAVRTGASRATIGISDQQWQQRTTRAGRRFG